MNIIQALERLRAPIGADWPTTTVFLGCGFQPLHLQTFAAAWARDVYPERRVEITTGLYGDLAGSLETLDTGAVQAGMIALEWPDLDPRLGIRALGGWRVEALPDILASAEAQAGRLRAAIGRIASAIPIALSLPTLPLPPLFPNGSALAGAEQLRLQAMMTDLGAAIAAAGARIVNPARLDAASPPAARLDVRSEHSAGFPYQMAHASTLAEALTGLLKADAPKKGLITDLDDTLWLGLLGELGVNGVAWDLDRKAQSHGLYQQFLASLASAGVLLAIASKNDQALVDEALLRSDLLLPRDSVFPVAANWGRKSESIRAILATWNIGADAVVFVDDSPMEVAEVKDSFPEMECLAFPARDPQAVWELLGRLRDLFGRAEIRDEDRLRLASIRSAQTMREELAAPSRSLDDFLQASDAQITFEFSANAADKRAFELVNKTNQFNLNGRRWSEADWLAYLRRPDAFLLSVSYRDKFGPLGKIGALLGRFENGTIEIDAWVLSCRAFSRRIEHQSLRFLFERTGAAAVRLAYQATPRNGPTQEFVRGLAGEPAPGMTVAKSDFLAALPPLFHAVEELELA